MGSRKVFRIESIAQGEGRVSADPADVRHRQLMAELKALKQLIAPTSELSERGMEQMRREHQEAMKIKAEMDLIYEAINRTKREIATLHVSGCNGHELSRVTDELDAVVGGTENATEVILSAAEIIDDRANTLAAKLNGDDQGLASDIQENIIQIFEACNFQDLTGQRITKVVNTLRFVEERIVKMMDIWGGVDSFRDIEVELEHRMGDQALLNGPALDADKNIASQDDIDALFA
ncbi:protein phosphatase CheZ [Methyloraptor flagellatus]|jgi:chemotaxis protein CheZ|uniref:Protein phosphatase CheZ n=1 Tax=Methyloraptor flagellatus TaxID=3162530 RepID=A0AAU7X6Z1_9HYPH